jgi:phosphoribosylformylglycinamidine (FGAM) synthase PurS component
VNAKRISNLAGRLYLLEDRVFTEQSIMELEPKKVLELYQMSVEAVQNASDYIKNTVKSTDWANIETQLISLANEFESDADEKDSADSPTEDLKEIARKLLGNVNLN